MAVRRFFVCLFLVSLVFLGIANFEYHSDGKLGRGFDLFVLFVVLWGALTAITPIMLVIRYLYKKALRDSLFYQLLCIANGEVALYGLWVLAHAAPSKDFSLFLVALLLSLILCVVMMWDIFRMKDAAEV
jgi:hypothetical protein